MKLNKKILIILSQYTPLQTPNVYRWQAIAEYWSSIGHDVHLLTSQRSGSPSFEKINKVSVYREGYNTLFDWLQSRIQSKQKRNETSQRGSFKKPSFVRRLTEGLLNITYRKRYWPDGSYMWIKPAMKRITSEFDLKRLDVVISVGLPFSAHLIARSLKEKEPGLHWLMDIEDPFCYSKEFWVNNFERYESKNITEEKKAFELANTISLTNDRAKEKYMEIFPFAESKTCVIPPMHTLPKNFKSDVIAKRTKKKMVFVGSFYENVRNPRFYLELIKRMQQADEEEYNSWHFEFYGQQNPWSLSIFEEFNSIKQIKIFGLKTRSEVFNVLKNSDIIVNISNRTDYHLPSKLVDYIWSGKPILNFYTTDKDQSKHFLSNYPLVCNIKEGLKNSHDTYNQFKGFLLESEDKELNQNQVDDLLNDYRLEVISDQYLKII